MPTIHVQVPRGSFPADARAALARHLVDAACAAERIPDDPDARRFCWIVVDEVDAGAWTCGGDDLSARVLTCMATVRVPAGVLDDEARAGFVRGVHAAFERARPAGDPRPLATSVVLQDVPDGTWGVNGAIWRLPRFAQGVGFEHLRPHPAP